MTAFPLHFAGTGCDDICRALLIGQSEVEAVRFAQDPDPDYIGISPEDLPY